MRGSQGRLSGFWSIISGSPCTFSRSYSQEAHLLTGSQWPGAQGQPGLLGRYGPRPRAGASSRPSLPWLWRARAAPTPGTPSPFPPQHLPAAGAALASGTAGCGRVSCTRRGSLWVGLAPGLVLQVPRAPGLARGFPHARTDAPVSEDRGGGEDSYSVSRRALTSSVLRRDAAHTAVLRQALLQIRQDLRQCRTRTRS